MEVWKVDGVDVEVELVEVCYISVKPLCSIQGALTVEDPLGLITNLLAGQKQAQNAGCT